MQILLTFDTDLLALWGEDFGKEIWETQIEPYSDQNSITLVFPEQISCVATSFGRGLLGGEINKLGINAVKRKYTIQSLNKDCQQQFSKHFWNCWD
jgi:hypothetical protein